MNSENGTAKQPVFGGCKNFVLFRSRFFVVTVKFTYELKINT